MEQLEGIVKLAADELNSIAQNGKFRNREEVDSAYKLVDIIKDAFEVWCMEEEMESGDDGMSSRGSYSRGGRGGSNRRNYFADGGSYYERGRGRGASRDGRGRYNEGSYRNGGMMRRGGYRDGSKEEFVAELHELMEDAPDEQTRQSIQRMIQQMDQM